jgi:IstB-like ATP binding protein
MLTHPTEQRLIDLGLAGMAKALEEQRRLSDVAALDFEERLGLLVDREVLSRSNKRLSSRLKFAGLRQAAVIEDVDMKAARGLDVMTSVRGTTRCSSGWPPATGSLSGRT